MEARHTEKLPYVVDTLEDQGTCVHRVVDVTAYFKGCGLAESTCLGTFRLQHKTRGDTEELEVEEPEVRVIRSSYIYYRPAWPM